MAAPGDGPILISNPSENGGPAILGSTLTVTIMALIAVSLRLYVRLGMLRSFGWDDGFMVFAMALTLAGQGVIIPEVTHGAGRHIGDVDPAIYGTGLMLNFITQPMFLISICIVKLSVGASLLRIASTKFYKRTILYIMCFMGFYTTGCFFTVVLQCTDIRVLWDTSIPSTCWTADTLKALSYTNVGLNITTDLLFAIIIPAPMLWKLNVNTRTRATLMAILGLGVFACAAAFVKIGFLVNYGKLGDWLWDSQNITIWTVVENNIGIVAGSLPCLRPLVKSVLGGSSYGNGTGAGGNIGPSGSNAYARQSRIGGPSLGKSGKSNTWQTLSSGRNKDPSDDSSSEKAITQDGTGVEQYEMRDRSGGKGGRKNTVTTTVAAASSDDSIDQLGLPMPGRAMTTTGRVGGGAAGITKTTTMNMTFSKA